MNFKLSIRLLNRGQFCSQLKASCRQRCHYSYVSWQPSCLPSPTLHAMLQPQLQVPQRNTIYSKLFFCLERLSSLHSPAKGHIFFFFQLKLSSSVISFYKAFSDSTHSPTAPLSLHTYLTALLESRSYLINYYIHRALLPSNRLQDKLMNEGMNTD